MSPVDADAAPATLRPTSDLPQETLDYFGGDDLRARVFFDKYALRDPGGRVLETVPPQMWRRIAREIASVEPTAAKQAEWEEKFYWLLEDFRFIPGGRIMHGAGNPKRVTLLNCYVIPVRDDSIESIFDWMREAARTYSLGGGVGTDLSVLRPRGAPVNNAARSSTGSVSFMELFSLTTGTIGQSGRRGALMITIADSHPDVLDFVKVKRNLTKVRYANISVRVSDAFMRAVESDREFPLGFANEHAEVSRMIRARDLWSELIKGARDYAEPGLIFWDQIKYWSTSEYNGMGVITTNPCSEIPLEPYGNCCLGNVNM
ncbi:MAG TPA: ribonucleotide reductase N-terminal alpha domain-containing protein, partial [bacterium]|nr:ribonucleotide reductase N-terminal alpha domain-containing protein [bacterium]